MTLKSIKLTGITLSLEISSLHDSIKYVAFEQVGRLEIISASSRFIIPISTNAHCRAIASVYGLLKCLTFNVVKQYGNRQGVPSSVKGAFIFIVSLPRALL